jgi:hypothetical protein
MLYSTFNQAPGFKNPGSGFFYVFYQKKIPAQPFDPNSFFLELTSQKPILLKPTAGPNFQLLILPQRKPPLRSFFASLCLLFIPNCSLIFPKRIYYYGLFKKNFSFSFN